MSAADLLRRAAALMRERANDATASPWVKRRGPGEHIYAWSPQRRPRRRPRLPRRARMTPAAPPTPITGSPRPVLGERPAWLDVTRALEDLALSTRAT